MPRSDRINGEHSVAPKLESEIVRRLQDLAMKNSGADAGSGVGWL